ncbi:synaptotagmin-15 [Trichonephila clavata]|uniref:Synaptotagmin-15 n=1 Tax=Trichonephila clavata TaxID=2740835 RepID=A0A8X6IKF6_TRICU|nr:synaptotagmin-15 [Trichonephila clavata]
MVKLTNLLSPFILQLPSRSTAERTLKFTVFDNDRGKHHNPIGHVLVPLKEFFESEQHAEVQWRDMEKKEVQVPSDLGEMMISLCYNQNLERLIVTVCESRGLRIPEGFKTLGENSETRLIGENSETRLIGENSETRLIGENSETRLIGENSETRLIGENSETRLIGENSERDSLVKTQKRDSLVKTQKRDSLVKTQERDSLVKTQERDSLVKTQKRDSLV